MKKLIFMYFNVLLLGLSANIGAVSNIDSLQQQLGALSKSLQDLTLAMNELPVQKTPQITKDFKGYVPIDTLLPGQLRFTQANVDVKKAKLEGQGQKQDEGRSSIPLEASIPIIIGPGGLRILKDSHHELLAAKEVGDTTAPIVVEDDLSNLSRKEFFQTAQERNHIYPFDLEGNLVPMPESGWFDWPQMIDDPNRYFAAITAWKCPNEEHAGFTEGTNNNYPLWIKRLWEKVKLAFIEFKISTVLNKSGIQYSYDMGKDLEKEQLKNLVEQAREALAKTENRIEGLDLVPIKTHRDDINKDNGGVCTYTYKVIQ